MASASQQVMKLGLGFIVSQALRVVADLDIAERLAAGPRRIEDLAGETGAHVDALYRIMRVLAAEGVFKEVGARTFELTETGASLRADAPLSARDMVRMMNRQPYLAFSELGYSASTGLPAFDVVFGKPRFDWLADHPDDAALFQSAMVSFGQGDDEAVAEAFEFGACSRIADVGGGNGHLLSLILDRHRHLSGILFDRACAIAAARERAGAASARMEYVTGDFFEAVPKGADVYILKRIIHDWNAEAAVKILKSCREAMAPGARLLIVESVLRPGDAPDPMKVIDAVMLVVTGGTERSETEYASLLAQAGLRLERVHKTARPIFILEASRAPEG